MNGTFFWLGCLSPLFYPRIFPAYYQWRNPSAIFSAFGVIDLATILPLYVMWMWPEMNLNYVFAWRAMRAIRCLRILKLLRFYAVIEYFLGGNR